MTLSHTQTTAQRKPHLSARGNQRACHWLPRGSPDLPRAPPPRLAYACKVLLRQDETRAWTLTRAAPQSPAATTRIQAAAEHVLCGCAGPTLKAPTERSACERSASGPRTGSSVSPHGVRGQAEASGRSPGRLERRLPGSRPDGAVARAPSGAADGLTAPWGRSQRSAGRATLHPTVMFRTPDIKPKLPDVQKSRKTLPPTRREPPTETRSSAQPTTSGDEGSKGNYEYTAQCGEQMKQ